MERKIEIRTVALVHVGDKLVPFEELTEEQRRRAATMLKKKWLEELWKGIGVKLLTEAEMRELTERTEMILSI